MVAAMLFPVGVRIGLAILILRMMAAFGPVRRIVLMRLGWSGMKPGPDQRRNGEEDKKMAHQPLVSEMWRG